MTDTAILVDPSSGFPLSQSSAAGGASSLGVLGCEAQCRTAAGAVTVLAPVPHAEGNVFAVYDADGSATLNAITVDGNGSLIDGVATLALSYAGAYAIFVFDRGQWRRMVSSRRTPAGALISLVADAGATGGGAPAIVPTITSISQNVGDVLGGDRVLIEGSTAGFARAVTFGGVASASIESMGADACLVVAPAGAAGAVDVVLTTPFGAVTVVGGYTYFDPTVGSTGLWESPGYALTAAGSCVWIPRAAGSTMTPHAGLSIPNAVAGHVVLAGLYGGAPDFVGTEGLDTGLSISTLLGSAGWYTSAIVDIDSITVAAAFEGQGIWRDDTGEDIGLFVALVGGVPVVHIWTDFGGSGNIKAEAPITTGRHLIQAWDDGHLNIQVDGNAPVVGNVSPGIGAGHASQILLGRWSNPFDGRIHTVDFKSSVPSATYRANLVKWGLSRHPVSPYALKVGQ